MARRAVTPAERVLRDLNAELAVLIKEMDALPVSVAWIPYRDQVTAAIERHESAIRNVTDNGLPPGWAEKWGK